MRSLALPALFAALALHAVPAQANMPAGPPPPCLGARANAECTTVQGKLGHCVAQAGKAGDDLVCVEGAPAPSPPTSAAPKPPASATPAKPAQAPKGGCSLAGGDASPGLAALVGLALVLGTRRRSARARS